MSNAQNTTRPTHIWLRVLWGVAAVYAAMTVVNALFGNPIPVGVPVLLLVAFVLAHGSLRYGWSGILIFIAIALVVSNILENTSILTGFPFGHYHYTDRLGPKLFLVPLLIGPAYIGTGYLAWVLATVLVGDVRRASNPYFTVAVPIIASFAMVVWDLCFDPSLSTILHFWIWEQGGGFFGVPLTNYLGWFLTVYLFYQIFALYLRTRGPERLATAAPRAFYWQAVALYGTIGLSFVLFYLSGGNARVTDAVGMVWQTGAIRETAAIVSLLTMLFIAVLTAIKLLAGAPPPPPHGEAAHVAASPVRLEQRAS